MPLLLPGGGSIPLDRPTAALITVSAFSAPDFSINGGEDASLLLLDLRNPSTAGVFPLGLDGKLLLDAITNALDSTGLKVQPLGGVNSL